MSAADIRKEMQRKMLNHPLLTREEERNLLRRALRSDQDALEKLVRHNQRLVYSIAQRFYHLGIAGDQSLSDMIQWGQLGLMHAVRKWDSKKNVRFSTYATYWIKAYIRRYGGKNGVSFGTSFSMSNNIRLIRRASAKLTQKLGREPTAAEIAAETGISKEDVRFGLEIAYNLASLDVETDEGDERSRLDVIAQNRHEEETYEPDALTHELMNALHSLSEREQFIVIHRFGLDGEATMTVTELARRCKVTPQRVAQISDAAIGKMRKMLE